MNVWILITNKFNAYRVILLGKQVAHLKLFALPPSLLESRLSLYAEKFSSAFLGDLEKWRSERSGRPRRVSKLFYIGRMRLLLHFE